MITQSEKYQNYLKEQAEKNDIELTDEQEKLLIEYMRLILSSNKQINLTSIKDPKEFIEKHLVDSLSVLALIKKENQNIIDVGTGGGFPGVPLAIVYPRNRYVLLDSTAKKLRIIESITKKLGIDNITFVHARAEVASQYPAYRDHFDYAVSRAVAQLDVLAELCLPFVKVGGEFIAFKNEAYNKEVDIARNIILKLNGEIDFVKEYQLPVNGDTRVLIDVIKKDKTPKKYPRKFSEIKNSRNEIK